MEELSEKTSVKIGANILALFWKLCSKDINIRLNACASILNVIIKKQAEVENANTLCPDLQYCLERLVKGMASPREASRLGFCLLLTQILKKVTAVQVEEILELMQKHLIITKQDKHDLVIGQVFSYTAIVRSGRLSNHSYFSSVILPLFDLCHGKGYILNTCYEILLDAFSQISAESFKENVWNQLKKKLPKNWDASAADTIWLLFLCLRLFPHTINVKYLKKRWMADDIFASENLNHVKKFIKQTSSSLPMLHPLCIEFFLLIRHRNDFKEMWTTVIEDTLFDTDSKDKAYIGFEMIKLALKDSPTRKIVKTVLSPKFCSVFSRSFLSSKHPMNPAANHLAEFLSSFAKEHTNPGIQIITLNAFIQPPGTVLLDQVLKKKEVSSIIQNLLPDAVKTLGEFLKSIILTKKLGNDEKEVNNIKQFQAVQQLGNLVAHPVILSDMEWRLDTIRFLFLQAFFTVKEVTSEIPHCLLLQNFTESLREACMNAFFKAINSLHMRTENFQTSLSSFLKQLVILTEYADLLMNSSDFVDPVFSVEKIRGSWLHLKNIIYKLSKQSKKDGKENESNAFQALFLLLGFQLFHKGDSISEVLEELYICCKKALKSRKSETEVEVEEPPWIGVVVDILLSLLSKSSKQLRSLVAFVFPLFCPFIDHSALQQILDVINPQKETDDMLVDESDEENSEDVEFGSGSSSDESEDEVNMTPVDDEFRKKIQQALGPAADGSDAESVYLSDSEMFKLDDALSHVFKSRIKTGHSQLASEDKTLLNFRLRCCDLILSYIKNEPPMNLALMCLEPILAAYELSHHNKHQSPLLHKTLSVLEVLRRLKKFQHHQDVSKSELKRLLEMLIPKCHKEINVSNAQKLYNLCLFIVLCFRKLETSGSPEKKNSKTPSYIKVYLSSLDTFVSSGSSNLLPQFFTSLIETCPDLSWHFIEPCFNYAFSNNVRLFKKTQCLGILSVALKYSKGQTAVTDDQWLEFGNKLFPLAIETLRSALDSTDIKPGYFTEMLNVVFTTQCVIQQKTSKSLLKDYSNLLPLLKIGSSTKLKKLNKKGKVLHRKIIYCLEGNTSESTKSEKKQKKRKLEEQKNEFETLVNGTVPDKSNKKKKSIGISTPTEMESDNYSESD